MEMKSCPPWFSEHGLRGLDIGFFVKIDIPGPVINQLSGVLLLSPGKNHE
jgi:hypothetical protein